MYNMIINYITYLLTGVKGWETMKFTDLFLYRDTYVYVETTFWLLMLTIVLLGLYFILTYIEKTELNED